MLRRAATVLLPHGALVQQAAACSSLQFSSLLNQTRSKSNDITAASNSAAASFSEASIPSAADFLDLPTGELAAHADNIISASNAAEAAVFAAAKGDCWFVTRGILDVLSWTHGFMPWFEAIAISSLVLKLLTMPLTLLTQVQGPKMAAIREKTKDLQALAHKAKTARTATEYEQYSQEFHTASMEFRKKHQRTLLTGFGVPLLNVAQTAILISHFSAVQSLTSSKLPSMTHEGGLWITNLTIPDPYFGLPVIAAAATITMLNSGQFGDLTSGASGETMRKVMYGCALLMIPAGYYASSGMALMWSSNALIQAAQSYVLSQARVRQFIGLPPLQGTAKTSFTNTMLEKVQKFRDSMNSQPAPAKPQGSGPPPPASSRAAVNYLSHKPVLPAKRRR